MTRACLCLWALLVFAVACGSSSSEPPADVGVDAGVVADVAAADSGPADAGSAVADVAPDAAPDSLGDIVPDIAPDIPEDLIVLAAEGSSPYSIVLGPDASASERVAAEELQARFLEVAGVELPIVDAAPADGAPALVVGHGPAAAELGVEPRPEALGEQGYRLVTARPHVVIAGTSGAGTMYGVHRFLEEALGVRWLAPGVTQAEPRAEVAIGDRDETVAPAFLWRHTSYECPGGDDAFWAHMADNAGDRGVDAPYGLEHAHDGRAHSYFRFIHPRDYFDEHPEYFSEIGGVRQREETQLCLTNPDVLEIVTEKMLQRMADRPGVRQHNFSQMDYYHYCQCDACSAINEQYGTAGGTQFWFVNQLAERTAAVYPDKLVGTLAYMYTEEPPVGLEMHPNTAVWLCHMFPSCDSHPISTCPLDADYKRRAERWGEIADHLYIWHYIVDFMHYYNPFPNFRAMAADMRFYRDIGVEGIYLQGMGHSGGGGEFSLLRPWYGMKLLWDPDQDADALLVDFLRGYYGEAWLPIFEWIELIHDEVEFNDIHMHLYTNPAQGYLSDDIVYRGEELFDEAETLVAGDEELLERVRVARMPLVYARYFPRNGYVIEDGFLRWQGETLPMEELNEFLNRMDAHGFSTVRETSGETSTMRLLYMMVANPLQVVTLENDHLAVDVVPLLGGRALRILHKSTGEYVTKWDIRQSLFYPFAGGVSVLSGGLFRFYGWVEPAAVQTKDDLHVTLTQETLDGYPLKRTLTLDPDRPILHVRAELTNPHSDPKKVRLRSLLELDLGAVRTTRVDFTARDGGSVDVDMTEAVAGMREGQHFYDQAAPDGAWTFRGDKGLTVTQRFDAATAEFGWIYAYPETLGEVEAEVWGPEQVIEPNAQAVFEFELEVGEGR